ncbi:MAG: Txe/YoeB family addiction module toxin [Janthinobacterium lividum]
MEAINFTAKALDDLKFWQKSGNTIILKRIRQLVQAIEADSFVGIGKPEALKHHLSGYWSRRINQEHRIVYSVKDTVITIYSLRFHYTP